MENNTGWLWMQVHFWWARELWEHSGGWWVPTCVWARRDCAGAEDTLRVGLYVGLYTAATFSVMQNQLNEQEEYEIHLTHVIYPGGGGFRQHWLRRISDAFSNGASGKLITWNQFRLFSSMRSELGVGGWRSTTNLASLSCPHGILCRYISYSNFFDARRMSWTLNGS